MPDVYRVVPDDPLMNILFYGDPGCGKTTLAGSSQDHPAMANVLFANVEGGLLSVAHRNDIHAIDMKRTQDLDDLFWELKKGSYDSVQTVVLDSATELQTINLEEIVDAAVKENKTSRAGKKRTADDIWQDDYGKSTVQLKRLFRRFKDLPINFIVTALAKFVYPKVPEGMDVSQLEPLVVMPSLTAKAAASLMGYMDFVWYMGVDAEGEKEDYYALTRPDGIYKAKTRGPRFVESIGPVIHLREDPSDPFMMPQIYDIYCEAQKGESAKKKSPTKRRGK